jgi:hypothetical protein
MAPIALFAPAALSYRPFDSTDAAVTARGEVEVEFGPLGYERFRQHNFAGLIAEGPDAWRVRPVGEVFLEGKRGARTVASVLAGGIWRVTQELSVDAAVRSAREAAGHVTEIRLGLTWAFAVGLPP